MSTNIGGLSRRKLLLTSSIVSATLLLAGVSSAAMAASPSAPVINVQAGDVAVKGVAFKNNDITLAGNSAAL
ncbi:MULTISPECIES: hypothetical protein [Rhodomicrobium]|uniref:hypothetical protein n=1 Tax=Rhodomicrobium TaxID=1068 RepID=UPI000B4B7FF5|nr:MULTISPECIES: hypothetical protein [Rhodomicrobium]